MLSSITPSILGQNFFTLYFLAKFPSMTSINNAIIRNRKDNKKSAVENIFEYLGILKRKDHYPSQLSGGERNRVHLAKMLKDPGNVLLLDEPTNDLDVDTLRALEEAILDFSGCVVVISHDRWFLNKLATHILAFEGGSHVEWFEGNYQDYELDKKRRLGDEALNPKRLKYKPIIR